MQIKTIGELVPYHKPLQELWGKVEFQPVLALLSSLKEDSIMAFRRIDAQAPDAELRAEIAAEKVQLNLVCMLLELPEYLKSIKSNAETAAVLKERFVNSQEGGNL